MQPWNSSVQPFMSYTEHKSWPSDLHDKPNDDSSVSFARLKSSILTR